MKKIQNLKHTFKLLGILAAVIIVGTFGFLHRDTLGNTNNASVEATVAPTAVSTDNVLNADLGNIPPFSGVPYVTINNNVPFFTDEEKKIDYPFEEYSQLDSLGRCGVAYANICLKIMPNEERGDIGMIKPSGWHTARYDNIVDGKYLYNRCHLIGFQLAGENANRQNLITGTRFMNVQGMLPFENEVADYINEGLGSYVLYRVTPIFEGNNLVASGVLMEAYSTDDNGEGVQFCVYCYNAQPGIYIDYATGESFEM